MAKHVDWELVPETAQQIRRNDLRTVQEALVEPFVVRERR